MTENPHYEGLKHRRSVFFVDQSYFVIVDEAVGDAKGTVNLNYHLCEGTVNVDGKNHILTSAYDGPSNMKLQCFAEKKASIREKEGGVQLLIAYVYPVLRFLLMWTKRIRKLYAT